MPYDAKILRKIRKSQAPITEVFSRAAGYAWLLKQGLVRSRAEPARREGVPEARITRILDLLKLHPAIIPDLQNMADPAQIEHFSERKPRKIKEMETPCPTAQGVPEAPSEDLHQARLMAVKNQEFTPRLG